MGTCPQFYFWFALAGKQVRKFQVELPPEFDQIEFLTLVVEFITCDYGLVSVISGTFCTVTPKQHSVIAPGVDQNSWGSSRKRDDIQAETF